ncbi:MAG: hypothetical protein BAJALOKI2v1_620029, partial [Promethearchaeota archaeon]
MKIQDRSLLINFMYHNRNFIGKDNR